MKNWLGDPVLWAETNVGTPIRFAISLCVIFFFTAYAVYEVVNRGWPSAWASVIVLMIFQFYFVYALYRLAAVHRHTSRANQQPVA